MKESAARKGNPETNRQESGVRRRVETPMEEARLNAAEEMQRMQKEYLHDKGFDPRVQIMTEQVHGRREEEHRRQERDKLEASPAWTNDTAKELRRPYEARRVKELIAMDQRIIAAENQTKAFTDMLTSLAEGDATMADAYFARKEAEAAASLEEHVRDARITKNAITHPEARIDWDNFETMTRVAEKADRNMANAQRKLKTLADKRRFLSLLATMNRKAPQKRKAAP